MDGMVGNQLLSLIKNPATVGCGEYHLIFDLLEERNQGEMKAPA
jgi:hypothetical protein